MLPWCYPGVSCTVNHTKYISLLKQIRSLFTGRFSDWLTLNLARRNNGIMEAEKRLWPFAACLVLLPGALILWGVGAAHDVHWFGLIVAMFLLAFVNTSGITISVNYLVDCYKELSGDAMASVMLVRNTMSFAIGYGQVLSFYLFFCVD